MFGREDEIFRPEPSYVSTPPKIFGRVEVFDPSVQVLSVPPKMFGRLVQLALATEGVTTTIPATMKTSNIFFSIDDLGLATLSDEKVVTTACFIQPPGRYSTVPLLILIPRLRRSRLLLLFDPLRCFPSSTDRQSFVRDLPMSS